MAAIGTVDVNVRPVFAGPNVEERFPAHSGPPSEEMPVASALVRADVVAAARTFEVNIPDGRWKALALTALEEALMWANKAIYNEKRPEAE